MNKTMAQNSTKNPTQANSNITKNTKADLENILYTHSAIKFARAYAIDDADLGQCLAVDIILNQVLNIEELQLWISGQTPRYLRPKSIRIIDRIETDSIGKPV